MPPHRSNELSRQLEGLFKDAPKAVIAAIAVSALTDGKDPERARALIALKWVELYEQGLVQQRPSRTARLLAATERLK